MPAKGRAYKIVSHWITKVNLHLDKSSNDYLETESVPLLEHKFQKRCCCLILDGPDSVWSWVIAFINFFINLIIIGLGRMSGILYVEFMHYFGISRQTASLPFSIQTAGRNLFGPLTGICGQKYGLRSVTILGGLIGSLSAAAIYFKLDILTVTIAWGVFFGLSTALTTTLNQISIDQYFEKNRTTAGGFAVSGGCVGALVFPVVLEILLHTYHINGTFLILAGVILLVMPAGVMLIEPPWLKQHQSSQNTSPYGSVDDDSSWSEEFGKDVVTKVDQLNSLTKAPQDFVHFRLLQENSEVVFKFLTMEIRDRYGDLKARQNAFQKYDKPRLLSEMEAIYASISGRVSPFAPEALCGPEPMRDAKSQGKDAQKETQDGGLLSIIDELPLKMFIRNRLKELSHFRGMNLVASFPYWEQSRAWNVLIELRKLYEVINDRAFVEPPSTTNFVIPKPPDKPDDKRRSNTFYSHMKTAISLHVNPVFLLICLCRTVFNLTFSPVVMIVVDFSMDMGMPTSYGKYAVWMLSVGDLVGRLCLGWVTDCGCLSLPMYMLLGMLGLGACSAALPLLESKEALLAGIFIYGILQGSLYVRHPILVSKYLEQHEQAIGMGFINLLSGILSLGVPLYIGYFRDELGSYAKMFYVNGIICMVVGLIWVLEPLFLIVCSANHKEKKQPETS